MILKMEKLSVSGLLADKEAMLGRLMRKRCIQIMPADVMRDYEQIEPITESGAVQSYELERTLSRYAAALGEAAPYATKGGLFARKPRVGYGELEDKQLLGRAQGICGRIEEISERMAQLRGQKSKDQFQLVSLQPWADNDLPIELEGTRSVAVGYCILPAKTGHREFEDACNSAAPANLLQILSEDREQKYALTLCHKTQEPALWDALKALGATRVGFSPLTGTAGENIAALNTAIARADEELARLERELRELGADIYPLQYAYDALSVRVQREKTGIHLRNTQKTFCFTGWVVADRRDIAASILEQYDCYYEFSEPAAEEEPPIVLKNNRFVAPFESVTQMYSLPAYRGVDPDSAMAPFFFVLFGMMLSDAGYGLLLVFGCWFMLSKMDLGPSGRKLVKVIQYGGVSTVIWGALFGSWFGDIIPVVAQNYFGITINIPKLLDPLADSVIILIMSLAVGMIHTFVGMGLNAYLMIRRGRIWDAVFDVGLWYVTLIGLLLLLGGMVLPGLPVGKAGTVMAAAGAVGLVLTQGRDKKNPIMKFFGGVMSLYDITGYFSDVLSYSRILALGLATGVIAQAVNSMGSMGGTGIVGTLLLIAVFLFGHALNLAINALGSYVHTSRLQYVEFFGRFFEGGGRPFTPLGANTKYIIVVDEEENNNG